MSGPNVFDKSSRYEAVRVDPTLADVQSSDDTRKAPRASVSLSSSSGVAKVDKLSTLRLVMLTSALAGCQFAWGIQVGVSTKTFRELGMPESFVSAVWLAGPISGMLVQPIVGAWSDQINTRWGKRKPFIFVGCILILLSMIAFSNSDVIGDAFGDPARCRIDVDETAQNGDCPGGLAIAVLSFTVLDFSINSVQGPIRTYLTDSIPASQQSVGNSWFAFAASFGNFCAYLLASQPLLKPFPFFQTELRALFTIGTIFIVVSITLSLLSADGRRGVAAETTAAARRHSKRSFLNDSGSSSGGSLEKFPQDLEDDDRRSSISPSDSASNVHSVISRDTRGDTERRQTSCGCEDGCCSFLGEVFGRIWRALFQMPKPVRNAFVVQCFTWFAWFTTFIYATSWVGSEVAGGDPNGTVEEAKLYDDGVAKGNLGLTIQSGVAIAYSVQLFIGPLHFYGILPSLIKYFGMKRMYFFSQVVQAVCLLFTPLAATSGSIPLAVGLFGGLGISWATTMTIPWAITGIVVTNHPDRGAIMAVLNLSQCLPEIVAAIAGFVLLHVFASSTSVLVAGGVSAALGAVFVLVLRVGDYVDSYQVLDEA